MPWILFALALGCFAIAFRTHSMGLAALLLLAALGLMLAGTLGLASARISRNSRSAATMLGSEEMRLVTENMRRKRENAAAGATGVVVAASAVSDPRGEPEVSADDAAGGDGGDGGGGD